MIIVFGATADAAPSLPDLKIRDAESGENIPVAGLEGWDDDFLQTQTICYAPLDFQTEETGMGASDETIKYWCRRLSEILLRVNFSTSGANLVIRPLYYDKDDLESIGDSVTITATSRQDGSVYMAPIEVFKTYGANKIAFVIDSISSGTANLSVAGV